MHLSADDLVDLADGTRPESSAPHLTSCGACRAQLADLRMMMRAAVAADVPEPSPLFWDQLSRRVHEAVEAEQASVAAAAMLIIAVVVPRLLAPRPSPMTPPGAASRAALDATSGPEAADTGRDDVWLTFVADLAAGIDADGARDEGLDAMNAEEAVMRLNDGELRELERLLQAQIRNQGD
jgi:hypothetical protein